MRTQKARDSRERLRTSSTSSSGQDKANSDLREQMVSLIMELEMKATEDYAKFYNHREGPYLGLLLVESAY